MSNETLEQLKEEYKTIKEAIDSNFRELEELEKNPIVARYCYLKNFSIV